MGFSMRLFSGPERVNLLMIYMLGICYASDIGFLRREASVVHVNSRIERNTTAILPFNFKTPHQRADFCRSIMCRRLYSGFECRSHNRKTGPDFLLEKEERG